MIAKLALDTNAYVAFLQGDKQVVQYVQSAQEIVLPFVVVGELYHGFYRGNKAAENISVLEEFLSSDRVTVQHSDDETTLIFGEIAAELADIGKPIQQNYIWIAAICKKNSLHLLSYDKGFKPIKGLKLVPIN